MKPRRKKRDNMTFEQWFSNLCDIAEENDIEIVSRDDWRDAFTQGDTPEGAFADEHPRSAVARED